MDGINHSILTPAERYRSLLVCDLGTKLRFALHDTRHPPTRFHRDAHGNQSVNDGVMFKVNALRLEDVKIPKYLNPSNV